MWPRGPTPLTWLICTLKWVSSFWHRCHFVLLLQICSKSGTDKELNLQISKTKTSFVRHCSKWSYWWNMSFWFFQLQRDMSQVDTSLKQFYEILMNSDAAHKYVNFTGKKTASLSNLAATSWFSEAGRFSRWTRSIWEGRPKAMSIEKAWTSPSSNPG